MTITSQQLLETARQAIRAVSVHDLMNMIQKGTVEIIDVRDRDECAAKPPIPGSHHASRGMLEFYIDPASDFHMGIFQSSKQLVFVCGSGGRASLAAKTARDMGVKDVVYLEGGMKAWLAHEHE